MNDDRRDALNAALQRTPDCVPVDRFEDPLSSDEQRHVDQCVRCQAELALWREFQSSAPGADEGVAVEWIAAELRRRRASDAVPARRPVRWLPFRWQTIGLSAAAILTLAVGYVASNREPGVRVPQEIRTYRSEQIRAVSPVGDVAAGPEGLSWFPVDGAVRYDVEILEVDRTPLFQASPTNPRLELPQTVVARFLPGKTILWRVRALDRGGRTFAQSGDQRFRVRVSR